MEININVKVKAGKRTPVDVTVITTGVNEKTLTLINGLTITDQQIAEWIDKQLTKAIKKIEEKQHGND